MLQLKLLQINKLQQQIITLYRLNKTDKNKLNKQAETINKQLSQLKNKHKAMKVLRSRLLDLEIAKQEAEISASRKFQVGTGDRSAKIRTYNFSQSRVTDHRISLTSYKLNNILLGELSEFVNALKLAYKNEMLSN